MIAREIINRAVKRLVQTYHPLKIYLFGSYAWGKPTEESDLDLLIVVDRSDQNEYQRSVAGHYALWGLLALQKISLCILKKNLKLRLPMLHRFVIK